MRGRLILAASLLVLLGSIAASAQTTIYWKRDHIYAGPGGGEIAIVTPPNSDSTAPTAPSGLSVTSYTATTVALSWTGSTDSGGSGLAGDKIYRQKASGASLPVGTVNSSTTAFTDQPLVPNTSYTYTIVAFDNAQNHSSASGSANQNTSTSSGDTTAPSVPGGLTAALTGDTSVLVRWNPSIDTGGSGVQGYKVYQNNTLISGSSPIAATSLALTGLSGGTPYSYKVEALDNASNVSAQTSTVTVVTPGVYFLDNFTRSDSSTLGSSWPDLSAYNLASFGIVSNTATNSSVFSYNMINPPFTKFKATATWDSGSSIIPGILLYGQATSSSTMSGYYVYTASGQVVLRPCSNLWDVSIPWPVCGSTIAVASISTSNTEMRVETNPATGAVKIYVDGVLKIDTTISTGTMSGYVGIFAGNADPVSFTQFKLEAY